MEPSNVSVNKKSFRCLIADDSLFARKNIARIIVNLGGEVVAEAANGEEAIALFDKLNPDLVLLDITMPVLDGVNTLKQIMDKDKNARVVIVSSVGHREMVWKAICMGAKHFVTKPYEPEYAGKVIMSVFEQ